MSNGALAIVAMVVIGAGTATAQNATIPPQPVPPTTPNTRHERLAFLEGEWTSASPSRSPAVVDRCRWMTGGRRHMICERGPGTPATTAHMMTVYGYRGADSTYTVTAFLPNGQVWRYAGRVEGEQWIFHLEPGRRDTGQRLRQRMTVRGDTLHFVEEASEDGTTWRLTDPSENYQLVRVRNAPDRP